MENKESEPLDELRAFLEKRQKEAEQNPPPAPPPTPEAVSGRRRLLVLGVQLAVMFSAAVYLFFNFPYLKSDIYPPKQLRVGSYNTDRAGEACIRNLWRIAAGEPGAAKAVCPSSGQPYSVSGRTASCPSPERHGLSELYYQPRKGVVAKEAK